MTLQRYTGYTPSTVAKDAKYSVTAKGEIRLSYRVDSQTRELLTTDEHAGLVCMVNTVKLELNGRPGGVFYLNEFRDVLVPDNKGSSFWAGPFDDTLEFDYNGSVIGPEAPYGLKPRDDWPGPHPGVSYVLAAGGLDIYYQHKSGTTIKKVNLSDEVGKERAAATAERISAVKGAAGGRFYINERSELFAPVSQNNYANFVYIGHLEDSPWFEPPRGYDRP